ncbi:glycosyltransferase family 4 protein [Larkinella terrae]|uniref:Glycosyltransferase n=1 Tax=Larkinella terrae TaxID=2025311 RepID=A0A7K0EGI2_9BACT|nr:glycosyltransferase family 4 protein [Larkinella terrae]MRS60943.1 glycosyltransferase [Larkinella terrae]
MRILLLHQFYLPPHEAGGTRWNELCRLWAQQGHQITVIAGMVHYSHGRKYQHCRGKWVVEEEDVPGVRVIRTHVSEWYNVNWLGRLWAYITFLFSGTWAGLFRTSAKYDVLIVTSPPLLLGLVGSALAWWKSLPLIVEIRDLWPDTPVQMGILQNLFLVRTAYYLEQRLYKWSERIVVLTPAFKQVLMKQKHIPDSKIEVVTNATDFELTDQLAATFNRASFRQEQRMDGMVWIVYAGAHGVANQLEQIVATAVLLQDQPVRFLLIGDGMAKKTVWDQSRRLLLQNIRFLHALPREEAFQFILASDIGIMTMQQLDVFKTIYANKMFEYMAARLPILTAIDGISRSVVELANAGMFIELQKPFEVAESIKNYLYQPELRRQQGNNGYWYAKAHFNRKIVAADYLHLIENVSKSGKTPD